MYDELYQSVKLRFGNTDATKSMGDWIVSNTTLKKRPFSFSDHEFQRAIADDMHPHLSVKKCSQIGLTEVQIRKFLAILTRSTALSGIFSLPNEKMFTKIYNGRIKPILEADEVFNPPAATKPTRSKDQVQIRDSFGYITACTEADATSISADFLFHDELDLSPQEIIALYQSRLQHSQLHLTQSFSTPTFSNYGIDREYQKTDQREYKAKCEACGRWQIPLFTPEFVHVEDFPYGDIQDFTELSPEQIASLNLEGSHVKCAHCGARLDLGNPKLREWVPIFPSRTNFRGYQVRPFSTPTLKPAYIFGQLAHHQERGTIRRFYNTVLGQEYTAADARIQKSDVEEALRKGTATVPNISRDVPCYIGIDVGFQCHITISYDDADGWPHFVLFETVPAPQLVERVEALSKIYNIVQGVIDRFPYTNEANEIRDSTRGLIVPAQWRGEKPLMPVFEADTKVLSHYTAGLTFAMDRLQSMFAHKKISLSGYLGQKDALLHHFHSMVRNDDPGDNEMAVWLKTDGVDHYAHSAAFNLTARRVGEHMFSQMLSTIATSSSFYGTEFGSAGSQPTLGLMGGSMKSLNRISRLG